MDDDELLSVCSELEAAVPERQYQTPEPQLRLRSIRDTSVSQQGSSHPDISASRQLCRTGEGVQYQASGPRLHLRGIQETQSGTSQCYHIHTSSSSTLAVHPNSKETGNLHPSGPTAKRPCLRSIIETPPVTPHRAETQSFPTTPLQLRSGAQSMTNHRQTQNAVEPGAGRLWQRSSPMQNAQNAQTVPGVPLSSPRPLIPSSLQTPVVTNHLVQLVTAANQTPRRLSWETPVPKERRFPGPAGMLPQKGIGRRLEDILVSTPHTPSHGARAKPCTKENMASQQPADEDFGRGPWAALKAELSLDENDPSCFLRTYSVVMVLRKAALKQLPRNKVPQMAVALKTLTPANGDASAVFRDPTGEIQGTVHHLLLEERESDLKVGSVLLLQQVGVFSPSHRNHYLNVTPSNLVKIYHPAEQGGSTTLRVSSEKTDMNSNRTQSRRPSSSTTQVRAPQQPVPGDWDMDDLDSFLCDLPEDTGD
ncbi:homologous recombination OB-fold protein [Rhinophrynus dorsalis]